MSSPSTGGLQQVSAPSRSDSLAFVPAGNPTAEPPPAQYGEPLEPLSAAIQDPDLAPQSSTIRSSSSRAEASLENASPTVDTVMPVDIPQSTDPSRASSPRILDDEDRPPVVPITSGIEPQTADDGNGDESDEEENEDEDDHPTNHIEADGDGDDPERPLYRHLSFSRVESVLASETRDLPSLDAAGIPGAVPGTGPSILPATNRGPSILSLGSRGSSSTRGPNSRAASVHWGLRAGGDVGEEGDGQGGGGGRLSRRRLTDLLIRESDSFDDNVDAEAELARLKESEGFAREREADPKFTLLHYVALLGCSTLSEAVARGSRREQHRFARVAQCLVGPRHKHRVFVVDKYGCTPLQIAAALGNLDMVKLLLEAHGLKPGDRRVLQRGERGYSYINHQDYQIQFSALHAAVSHAQHDVTVLLLQFGANPQVLDVNRSTAFGFQDPSLLNVLQRLLRLVLRHEDEIPRLVVVQLMAEMLHAQTQFSASQMWNKAVAYVSFKTGDDSQRFESVASELMGNGRGVDVAVTVKRYFQQLYKKKHYHTVLDFVSLAIKGNHGKLTEIMIDLICDECPDVLTAPRWHEVLEPLVCSYPTIFHRLLYKLQFMRDEDVRGFVRCLSPANFDVPHWDRPGSALGQPHVASQRSAGTATSRSHAANRVKLLIYQQLVEGLRKVSYRVVKTFFEESDQKLLNDMAQFPVFADFVGLIANKETSMALDESDSCRQLLLEFLASFSGGGGGGCGNDSLGGSTLPPPSPVGVGVGTALASPTGSHPTSPAPWQPGGRPSVAWAEPASWLRRVEAGFLRGSGDGRGLSPFTTNPAAVAPAPGPASPPTATPSTAPASAPAATAAAAAAAFIGTGSAAAGAAGGAQGSGAGSVPLTASIRWPNGVATAAYGSAGMSSAARSAMGGFDAEDAWVRRSLQTLNVRRVLTAALGAGKAGNVEAAVASIVSWVETNSKDNKAIFLAGVSAQLVQQLATRFPSACALLLNLVSRDVLDQLATLQVSAAVLYNREHLIKCSHVHNHFTWREQELKRLRDEEGYDEHVVDALVDYGVPFECIYKAAVEMGAGPQEGATPQQFAKLIEHKFSGPELKLLISNGIRLSKVIGYIEECAKPLPPGLPTDYRDKLEVPMAVLLREMLRQRLSPLIVDVVLREAEGKMFETTRYNNFRPGRVLRDVYPEPLFHPKYTHHFVQMLLIQWRRGVKGKFGPWAKEFIDSVFEPNDPLCTKLKSAYDNKLTDTHVYIQGEEPSVPADAAVSKEVRQLRELQEQRRAEQERKQAMDEWASEHQRYLAHVRHLLRIFISNPLLFHRWPVFLAAQLLLLLSSYVLRYWQRTEAVYYREKVRRFGHHHVNKVTKARQGTIDAACLVFPLLGFFHTGRKDMLTALVDADAPSSWFHFALVRALYSVHWIQFGRVMILLGAACQLQFALVFLTFFLLVLNYAPASQDGSGDLLRDIPPIQAFICTAVTLSASMLVERIQEIPVPQLATWVRLGRGLELCCHGLVWAVAIIVWVGGADNLVPSLSGMTMLLFMARLTLFGLVTDKLSTAVLALMEILIDARYFFFLIGTVYGGFVLAVAGLRSMEDNDSRLYSARLFTVLLGDFPSSTLTDEREFWRYADVSLVLMSLYGVIMLIIFMNLLIATMNDTYDRVKEFSEVEVMRLRSHMMVFVKDFMERSAGKEKLASLNGDVLHLLLRPEAVRSSRLLPLGGDSDASESTSWVGRIGYMRASIVREVDGLVRDRTDAQLSAIQERLEQVEDSVAAKTTEQHTALSHMLEQVEAGMAALAAEQHAALSLRLERLEAAVSSGAAVGAPAEQLATLMQQLDQLAKNVAALAQRVPAGGT